METACICTIGILFYNLRRRGALFVCLFLISAFARTWPWETTRSGTYMCAAADCGLFNGSVALESGLSKPFSPPSCNSEYASK
jgi:hypothetical protein